MLGWDISNTLDAQSSLRVLQQAIAEHGKPKIVNSDQCSQCTCSTWVEHLNKESVLISMDGKGRAIDNVFIERLWRSVKYEYVYLRSCSDVRELYQGLQQYFTHYNHYRPHQGIERRKPVELYRMVA